MENDQSSGQNQGVVSAPSITLPKGGGAIRGIGEKFAANPVTGTGSLSIPIATSPGRSGFGPQLSLSYDSGAGNGPFGLGWNLSLPSISRKTDKGLPKYQDATESDVFILSGAEDLVPVLVENDGDWIREAVPTGTLNGTQYQIQRYRPRIEGLFARIERWTNETNPVDMFWRSISRDNITTWYGKSDEINLFQANERNRNNISHSSNHYLKRIKYGNIKPYLPDLKATHLTILPADWMFEVVFDYGEHDEKAPSPDDNAIWDVRLDPFSSYRAGFEVRTCRLCQRVLMFHHFPDVPEVGKNCLVRSTDFNYRYEQSPADSRSPILTEQTDPDTQLPPAETRNPIHTVIYSVTQCSYLKQSASSYSKKTLPPVEFGYSQVVWGDKIKTVEPDSIENLPYGVDGSVYQWVDLDGEGLSGVLTEQGGAWFYKHNESPVTRGFEEGKQHYSARLGATQIVKAMPAGGLTGTSNRQFLDLAGNGQIDLVELAPPLVGFYQRSNKAGEIEDQDWEMFRAFKSRPNIDWNNPNLKFFDLTGDGHADILITENEVFTWYPSLAEAGFGESEQSHIPTDEEQGPRIVFADLAQTIFQADLSGDGLTDIARIRNGEVCYWPNLGYGRFGAKVTMDDAPWFDTPDQFNPRRLRLADIDGSGMTDLIYLGRNKTQFWLNQSGNRWSSPHTLKGFPPVDNIASVSAVDLLGNGTACLVWSTPLPGEAYAPMRYLELMAEGKPHLLVSTKNKLGAETHIQYAPSTYFYLKDKQAGKPWITKLPFPVHVVEKVTVTDKWRKTQFSTTYSYHHGYFDGEEREFRGFGRVEQIDVESYGEFTKGNINSPFITDDHTLYQPPVKTITWYHTGAVTDRDKILSQFKSEYFPNWLENNHPDENVLGDFHEAELPEPDIKQQNLDAEEFREAMRACKGIVLRQEIYELDVDVLAEEGKHQPVKLYSTAYHNCHIQQLQKRGNNPHAVFLVIPLCQHTCRL
jgi:virulence plasmid B protein/glycosyltransferase TcdB-like subunit of Tc toxin/glycosyltransferase TcdB-like subunit of Tc toxinin